MSKSSHFSAGGHKRMKEIAIRIQSRMRQLNLSASQLSESCSLVITKLDQDIGLPSLRRDRIAKILMNCKTSPEHTAARAISESELKILARALRCSAEWLSGKGLDQDPIVWNVLTEPERGGHLLHLLEEYEERTSESIVWSEYLPCSFTTEEFMVAFHRVHFGEMDTAGIAKDRRQLVEFFDRTGRARRKRLLKPGRPFLFTSLIYESELKRIVSGVGIYSSIPKQIRKATLRHIARVLTDSSLKMNLIIVNDDQVHKTNSALRDYETMEVMGELFSLWNYHSGSVGWTEDPRHVKHNRELLCDLKRHAITKSTEATVKYLRELAEQYFEFQARSS